MGTSKRERQRQGRQLRREEELRQAKQTKRKRMVINGVLLLVGFVVLVFVVSRLVGGGGDGDDIATDTTVAETDDETADVDDATGDDFAFGTGACAPVGGASERVTRFDDAPQRCIDPDATYVAVFDTSAGEIRVELDTDGTPGTANNFVNLARFGYYDGTPIFRTDPSIDIIQGGGQSPSDPGPGYTIPDEGSGFSYEPGQLVMARTGAPDSAGAQFFFVAGPGASALDAQGTYVVFGNVVEGLDVVEAILASHEDQPDNPLGGAPNPPVTIRSVTIEEA